MDELKQTGFETADALDRLRAVHRGQPFNILWPSDLDEAILALEEKLNRRPAPENKPLTGWIPVGERMPEESEPVYAYIPAVIGRKSEIDATMGMMVKAHKYIGYTHWMPRILPQPPEVE